MNLAAQFTNNLILHLVLISYFVKFPVGQENLWREFREENLYFWKEIMANRRI
jgi:hypothetical protein